MTKPLQVAQTHWAESDKRRWEDFKAELPKVEQTNLELWQLRVDRSAEGKVNPFVPHSYLFNVSALRYSQQKRETGETIFAPVEPKQEFSFLVVVDGLPEAREKVFKQLEAHGFTRHEFSLCCGNSIMVLS